MVLVRMGVSLYGKAKMVPGYLKHPSVEWLDDDQIEGYNTSDGTMVLEIHKDKVKVDDAKRNIPLLEKDLVYQTNQIGKINKELADGRLGRQGDLDRFETKAGELREAIREKRALVDGAEIERITFEIEDCY